MIRFPDLADFVYDPSSSLVECWPAQSATKDTVNHLYLNQVLPLAMGMKGRLVLHASAVQINDQAILFVGPSGIGKSTLATYFAAQGDALISEDGVVFAPRDGDLYAEPGHTSVRLWPDSINALFAAKTGAIEAGVRSIKTRIVSPPGISFSTEALKPGAIFHLKQQNNDRTEMRELAPRAALQASLAHIFLLDDRNMQVLAAHFDQLTTLANTVPHYLLSYPRTYDALPKLRHDILDKCER